MYRKNLAIRWECFLWKHNESGLSGMLPLVPLGALVDGEMMLNKNGEIVESVWNDLPNHYAHVELDRHIIMPNHIHGIMIIVGAGLKPAPTDTEKTHGLPEIICGLKTFSARRINQIRNTPGAKLWQRNYYEHIVRNENELNRIRQYIIDNPKNWKSDRNYPTDNVRAVREPPQPYGEKTWMI